MNPCYLHVSETFPAPALHYYARSAFTLAARADGHLRLAARQFAVVWINGVFLGRTYTRHHDHEMRYSEFDLTPHLRIGANVVAVLLHSWGRPDHDVPGVYPPGPVVLAAAGTVGSHGFAMAGAWRVAPASMEYQPARRHNDLIGHEEYRDLRQEPHGWREPGFDADAWSTPPGRPHPELDFLPTPLPPLREELAFPARIVNQGTLIPAETWFAVPPAATHRYWRITFTLERQGDSLFYYQQRLPSRCTVDGASQSSPWNPPFPWVELYQPCRLLLEAGTHVIAGYDPPAGEFQNSVFPFGWNRTPAGGQTIEWAPTPDGPFAPGKLSPDPDHRPMVDTIVPETRAALGSEGTLDLIVEDTDYAMILEFPKSITMLPRVEVAQATAGVELELVYSERLSDLPGLTLPAAYTDRVILREGAQTYEPAFQYKSARILVLIVHAQGGRACIRNVSAVYRHYDYALTGRFSCNEPRLVQAWEICRNTMEAGSQDIIMDGPWREQLLYIGDNQVHNLAAYHLFGNHEIVEWQHTLYAQGQMPDGIFQPNQPCRPPPEHYRLLDQTILWPIQLEQHWLYTGRVEFIEPLLPNMIRLLDGLVNRFGREADPRLREVTGWNWVDHPGLEDGAVRPIRHDGIPTGINLLQLLALQSAIRLLRAYGRIDEAARLDGRASALRSRLLTGHWNERRGLFADCVVAGVPSTEVSLHLNLLAILAGLPEDPHTVLDRSWRQPGVLQLCGPFFRVHLFEVLHRLNRIPEMLAEIRSVWGSYVDAGLTTTPENEAINGEFGSSVGHPWGASPAIYLARSIAGLTPLEPGWRVTRFTPNLCDLKTLAVTVPTPHGPITARLGCDGRGLTGTLNVPAGITMVIPDTNVQSSVQLRTV